MISVLRIYNILMVLVSMYGIICVVAVVVGKLSQLQTLQAYVFGETGGWQRGVSESTDTF